MNRSQSQSANTSRREFLKTGTGTILTGAIAANLSLANAVYAEGSDEIKVGLIGCGGRGTGAAAQALNADKNAKLVAMADAFPDRLESSLATLQRQGIKDQVAVSKDNQFVGFNAYQDLIKSVDVVLMATPPHFRPAQLKEAIEAGKHVFVEKPVAVDAPGVRSVIESCKLAKEKNLSVVSGLCWRYHLGMQETFQQIHEGNIGEITSMQCSYLTRGLWHHGRNEQWSDLEWQVRNWLYFTWLSGDHINEQHIHSLDKLAWAMQDEYPVQASGVGGRQTRIDPKYGNIYDHFSIVYEYKNGVKGFGRCRQQNGCTVDVSDHIYGTKGIADVFKHRTLDYKGNTNWRYKGPKVNMYQAEHNALFAAIREGKPINNGEYMSKSTMMAILGRMVAYTGKTITWEQALNSKQTLGPNSYEPQELEVEPIAMPGSTPFV